MHYVGIWKCGSQYLERKCLHHSSGRNSKFCIHQAVYTVELKYSEYNAI